MILHIYTYTVYCVYFIIYVKVDQIADFKHMQFVVFWHNRGEKIKYKLAPGQFPPLFCVMNSKVNLFSSEKSAGVCIQGGIS